MPALGQIDEPGVSAGGSRCLSLAEQYIASDREVLMVEQALRDIETDGGWNGRQMAALADVRYARHVMLPLAVQQQRLGMSRKVYRARLDQLHVEVAARWPALSERLDQLVSSSPAQQARQAWRVKVERAAKQAEKARNQRLAEAKKQARQIHAKAKANQQELPPVGEKVAAGV